MAVKPDPVAACRHLENILAPYPLDPQFGPLGEERRKPFPAVDGHHGGVAGDDSPGTGHNHAGIVTREAQRVGKASGDYGGASEVVVCREQGDFHVSDVDG